ESCRSGLEQKPRHAFVITWQDGDIGAGQHFVHALMSEEANDPLPLPAAEHLGGNAGRISPIRLSGNPELSGDALSTQKARGFHTVANSLIPKQACAGDCHRRVGRSRWTGTEARDVHAATGDKPGAFHTAKSQSNQPIEI